MPKPLLTLACCAVLAFGASAAYGDSIGPDCGSGNCLGNIYTLTYSQNSSQKGTDKYTITLTLNTSGFVDGTDSGYLMAVSPNITGWTNAVLDSAPGGTSDWSAEMAGGLNSSGCDGHGTPFFCNGALSQGTFDEVGSSTPLVFTWTITDSKLPTGTDAVAIKALFENSSGSNLGITSADLTLQQAAPTVPEPASVLLLGSGLLAMLVLVRRRLTA